MFQLLKKCSPLGITASPVNNKTPILNYYGGRALRPPFFLLAWLLVNIAQAEELPRFDFSGPGMATTFHIACHAKDALTAEQATDACFKRIAELNNIFTDYDPTSELMRLCAPEALYPMRVSAPLYDILQRARQLAEKTQGAFDPTCGHLSQLWRRAKRQGKLPPTDRLTKAVAATDWKRITLHPESYGVTLKSGTLLDLGGIAKGYAADECQRILKKHGITQAVVQAGGDTAVTDAPPGKNAWPIKLRADAQHETSITLTQQAVSTSGDLYQFVEIDGQRFSHIISPRTGFGLTTPIACSVIAPDCTTSDALATAMCVLGRAEGFKIAASLKGIEVRFAP
jgi:thiamine biosynthesis lipoprotein